MPGVGTQNAVLRLNRAFPRVLGAATRYDIQSPLFGHMRVDKIDSQSRMLYFFGIWEPALTRLVTAQLQPDRIFVDVGANLGYYSLVAGRQLAAGSGHVIAFEPSPTLFRRLAGHVRQNGLTNVTLRQVAVADTAGTLPLYLGSAKNLGATSLIAGNDRALEIDVPVDSLTELLRTADVPRVQLIKIDVEGAEHLVLLGMHDMLDDLARDASLLVELTRRHLDATGATPRDIFAPFHERRFRFFAVPNSYEVGFYGRNADSRRPTEVAFNDLDRHVTRLHDFYVSRQAPLH
jgi:FkbM family methyltransferase